jgi:hypothetical protein
MWRSGSDSVSYGEADRRAVAGCHHAIRAETVRFLDCLARDLDRHMHHRMRIDADTALAETARKIGRERHLVRCG